MMICTKCSTVGQLKQFITFQYYFCPKCKDEIKLEVVVNTPTNTAASPNKAELLDFDGLSYYSEVSKSLAESLYTDWHTCPCDDCKAIRGEP